MRFEGRKTSKKIMKRNRRKKRIFLSITLIIFLVTIGIQMTKLYNSTSTRNKVVQASTVEKVDDNKKQNESEKDEVKDNKVNIENVDKHKLANNKNVNEEGLKYTIDRNEVTNMLKNNYKSDGKKYVFLTFDDGPSNQNTADVLDILKSKNVKGTFFVLGENIKNQKGMELLKREYNEGHAIGNHSYTHNFRKLYPGNKVDVDYFMNEIENTNTTMKGILGNEFDTKVIRMPGGYMSRSYYHDPNLNNLNEIFKKEGIVNIDWNALNGDAEGKTYSKEYMFNYVIKTSKGKDKVVILMHDAQGKVKTKELLPQIIDYFKGNGYEFKTIS
ncbi:Peptidoglycan/xylan/chitin deacetylase, PgdA/CDA1 family [Clostridium cavendishii DSM 21758]|uniref:Peptidoglycan/xylan/chitin deacetylase, PgdA/CDA1 family n=1 Tax=Clostridium cavendishii DSM 21758 TaxID=1121302 RepID=A0A1M6UIB7_9CLOT|nr:polysaccharide deacetylase family protein [Clostridium cavendishii]SHK68838.1 Peptidoglycan/xylan/chitin deacetylase, PgdA/CDA1 family [Clostridium cavendishii DSM 21758]